MDVETYGYIDDLNYYYRMADLIICHCGAGTMLDCFQFKKTVCTVVNESLFGNHQRELYDVLVKNNYIKGIESVRHFSSRIEEILIEINREGVTAYP